MYTKKEQLKNKIKFENRNNKRRILIHIKQEGQYSSQVIDTYIHIYTWNNSIGNKSFHKTTNINNSFCVGRVFQIIIVFLCNFSWNLMGGKEGEVVGQ